LKLTKVIPNFKQGIELVGPKRLIFQHYSIGFNFILRIICCPKSFIINFSINMCKPGHCSFVTRYNDRLFFYLN